MLLRRRHTQVGPADIHYQVSGAGEPLVLVHGLSGSTRWWRRNVGVLSERYRVYVVDLISFGRSRGPHRFVLGDAAGTLAAWMESLGLGRAGLVGHSMGGFIAADLAATFPERVGRLVLVAAAALPMGRTYLGHALGLAQAVWRLPLDFYPVLVSDALLAGPRTILSAGLELLSTDITDRLARIAAPTLIVWGEHDTAVPVAIGRQLHARLPDARFEVIAGAGHNPMWDRPEVFNRIVLDFLSTPPPAQRLPDAP